jgi:histidinol dehydrogenase
MKIVTLDASGIRDFKETWEKRQLIPKQILEKVLNIIFDVQERGDEALKDYTFRFDQVDLKTVSMEITQDEIEKAYVESKEIIPILETAAQRITTFHQYGLPKSYFFTDHYGNVLGQRITPIEHIGVYCPGGKAVYPSTVLMNVIPAQVAGAKEIVMCVPTPKGEISKAVLAAAKIAGVNKIFRLGGAQAIAAMAYGTETVPKVDFICGPGNIYIAAAKKLVFGEVGIDMVAGPSEIAVIADGDKSPAWVAADLLSQAEHDEMAGPTLITTSERYAHEVLEEIKKQLGFLTRKAIASEALEKQGHIFIVPDLNIASEVVNTIAPEHLELLIVEPLSFLDKIKHAGAIFLGQYAVEALGDYIVGPNHTLPTGGTARFSSVLSSEHFLKRSSVLFISREGLFALGPKAVKFAQIEGLTAHAASVEKRLKENKD